MASEKVSVSTPEFTVGNLTVVVRFRFEEQWEIGRVSAPGSTSVGVTGDRLRLPAGGGLTPPQPVEIGPIHLKGLPPDQVAQIIRERAAAMAILADLTTMANIQFREALDSIATGAGAADKPPQ